MHDLNGSIVGRRQYALKYITNDNKVLLSLLLTVIGNSLFDSLFSGGQPSLHRDSARL